MQRELDSTNLLYLCLKIYFNEEDVLSSLGFYYYSRCHKKSNLTKATSKTKTLVWFSDNGHSPSQGDSPSGWCVRQLQKFHTQSADRLMDTSAQLLFIWSGPHQNMMMPTFRVGLLNSVDLTKIILPQALLESKVIEIAPCRDSYNFLS